MGQNMPLVLPFIAIKFALLITYAIIYQDNFRQKS